MKALKKVKYKDLNSKQKERYNFHKIAAILAEYGYSSIKLDDDYNGADFIALHIDGSVVKVQLKARLTFDKKYIGKTLYVAFPYKGNWYLYNHDSLLKNFKSLQKTKSWSKGTYSYKTLSAKSLVKLEKYKL